MIGSVWVFECECESVCECKEEGEKESQESDFGLNFALPLGVTWRSQHPQATCPSTCTLYFTRTN